MFPSCDVVLIFPFFPRRNFDVWFLQSIEIQRLANIVKKP